MSIDADAAHASRPRQAGKGERALWPSAEERLREREQKQLAVLHAAVRLFNQKGFRNTSLDDIARALRITKPTLYNYFASKEEILFASVRLGCDMIERAAAVANGPGGGRERLRRLMLAYAEVMTMDFGRCVILIDEHELSPESRAEFRSLKRAIDSRLRDLVEDGMRDGSIAPGDVKLTSFTIAGALNWIGHWYEPEGEASAAEVAAAVVDRLVGGLAPRPAAGRR